MRGHLWVGMNVNASVEVYPRQLYSIYIYMYTSIYIYTLTCYISKTKAFRFRPIVVRLGPNSGSSSSGTPMSSCTGQG